MKSVTRSSVIAMLCWVVVTKAGTTDVPETVLDFFAISNGVYSDRKQVNNDNEKHDIIDLTIIPAKIPALGEPLYYMDETVYGMVYRQEVHVFSKFQNGVIYLTAYNFTNSSSPDPKNFNISHLENLSRADFQTSEGCGLAFERLEDGVYMGTRADCRETKQHPLYVATLTCDSYHGTPPVNAKETTTRSPYELTLIGERFPAINLPADYVGPCDRKQSE